MGSSEEEDDFTVCIDRCDIEEIEMRVIIPLAIRTAVVAVLGEARPACKPKQLRLPEGVTAESLADAKEAARVAAWLDKEYPKPQPEGVRMPCSPRFCAARSWMGIGWFGPAATRYTWDWLRVKRNEPRRKGQIHPARQVVGRRRTFDALDRDGDGEITRADLDWSDRNPYVMQGNMLNRIFRRMDRAATETDSRGNGCVLQEAGPGQGDFHCRRFPPRHNPRGGPTDSRPGMAPRSPCGGRGLFAGEIGSISEGPKLDAAAPVQAQNSGWEGNGRTIQAHRTEAGRTRLRQFHLRAIPRLVPGRGSIRERYKDRATFVMVYVREAHPTDGWSMQSNARFGVAAKQPKSYEERVRSASCSARWSSRG